MSNDRNVIRPRRQDIAPLNASITTLPPDVSERYAEMMGLIRDIRAEVQNLQTSLQSIIDKEAMDDAAMRTQELFATVQANQSIYDYNSGQIGQRLDELRRLTRATSTLYDRYGDEITHIENHWERATYNWPMFSSVQRIQVDNASEANTEELQQQLATEIVRGSKKVFEHLNDLVYHAALLTIPGRLNQHLEQLRIGQALDFHGTFADEVPQQADRQRILDFLDARPAVISNGVVDAKNGVVFHASPRIARRRLSFILIGLAALLGGILVFVAAEAETLLNVSNWPLAPDNTTQHLIEYGFALVGALVHLGVDAIKQARSSAQGIMTAIEDWLAWVHINEVGVIVGILSVLIGYFALIFTSGTIIGWETAFLIGYSIDSFIDMFLQRFSSSAAASASKIVA